MATSIKEHCLLRDSKTGLRFKMLTVFKAPVDEYQEPISYVKYLLCYYQAILATI